MDHMKSVRTVEQAVVLLLSEEVSLVLALHLKSLAHLGQLVVGHVEVLAPLELVVVEASASLGGGVGHLVADECTGSPLDDLDGLDLAALAEELVKALLGVGGR